MLPEWLRRDCDCVGGGGSGDGRDACATGGGGSGGGGCGGGGGGSGGGGSGGGGSGGGGSGGDEVAFAVLGPSPELGADEAELAEDVTALWDKGSSGSDSEAIVPDSDSDLGDLSDGACSDGGGG